MFSFFYLELSCNFFPVSLFVLFFHNIEKKSLLARGHGENAILVSLRK
jgi:hypothetical protein